MFIIAKESFISCLKRGSVTCIMFIRLICCLVIVSVDPDIEDIDSKQVVVKKMFVRSLDFFWNKGYSYRTEKYIIMEFSGKLQNSLELSFSCQMKALIRSWNHPGELRKLVEPSRIYIGLYRENIK